MKKSKQYKPKKNPNAKKFTPLAKRRSSTQLGYDYDWQKYRFRFLHYNPHCYACGSTEKLHVDHLIPHRGDVELFKKLNNHIPLCDSCHGYVTLKYDKVTPPNTQGKIAWLNTRRKEFGITTSVRVLSRYSR